VLGQGQAPVTMKRYPHMLYQDRVVWTKYLERFGRGLGRCWYDVLVGSPIQTPAGASEADVRLARGTGCKRIDVVIWRAGVVGVVEVKPYGNHAALGQSVLYRNLFMRDYPEVSDVLGMIACHQVDPDVRGLGEEMGLEIVEVGPVEIVRRD
jgi:hypothetical protein